MLQQRPSAKPCLLALSILATTLAPTVHAAPAASAHAQTNLPQQARAQSQNLVALQKRWSNSGQGNAQLLGKLVQEADTRRETLRSLMQQHPEIVLQLAIPAQKQMAMPKQVIEKLEQRLSLQGQLEVFYEDKEDGGHQLKHYLETPFGERFELHFAGKPGQLKHGQEVELDGVLVAGDAESATDGDVALEPGMLMLAADGGSTGGSNGGTAADSATFGAQSTLVINVNFSDDRSEPWTPEQARSTVFDQASEFIYENSFGQTWLTGDVTPWLNLPINGASCDTTSIVNAAMDAAASAGYDTSQYNRLIFAMPSTSTCGFSGVGSVGGTNSTMIINGSMYWFTVAHEMGHNLGLYHSHALECGTDVLGSNCSSDEYGDGVDIMGRVSGHFTTFQKERLGWLDSRHIQTVTSSGLHELEPYAGLPGNAPKALKIAKGTDAASGEPEWFYVEYRHASGYDNILASNANVQNGVVVHTGISNKGNSSYMLDMTPGSKSSSYTDTRDPALEVGQQFTDPDSGVTLATEWVDGTLAQVNVQLDGSPISCTPVQPTLDITPGTTVWTQSGATHSYTLTLTNRDSSTCASSQYSLAAQAPSGWSSQLGNTSLTLAPGETQSLSWSLTTAESATDGYYTLTASATSGSVQAQDQATVVIDNPVANTAPVALGDSANTAFETPVTIEVLANDSDVDGDSLSVTSVNALNGTAQINGDNSITFTPAQGFSGLTSFSYSISDGQGGSDSANLSIQVEAAPEPEPVPNEAPVAVNDSASTEFETAVTFSVLGNDHDPEGGSLSITAADAATGNVRINADGTLTFTPANGFSGQTSLSYTVQDPEGASATATVIITVAEPASVNEAPVAIADSVTLSSKQSVQIAVLANDYDPEGSTIEVSAFTQGNKGSVRLNSDGTLTYTPAKSFKRDDSFSYTISDGDKAATATVSIVLSSDSSSGGSTGGPGNGKGKNK
ncbi:Ig-like domain-containing protein [Marinobacterium stanieri]|uniref:Ig-like domain-containing protein n=1 Tax=Marinobacterium stanieri TaxID=49186 RepID=UPI0002559324|nr:cadherin-like domain-containing protein [Marinobacterium stanieri]